MLIYLKSTLLWTFHRSLKVFKSRGKDIRASARTLKYCFESSESMSQKKETRGRRVGTRTRPCGSAGQPREGVGRGRVRARGRVGACAGAPPPPRPFAPPPSSAGGGLGQARVPKGRPAPRPTVAAEGAGWAAARRRAWCSSGQSGPGPAVACGHAAVRAAEAAARGTSSARPTRAPRGRLHQRDHQLCAEAPAADHEDAAVPAAIQSPAVAAPRSGRAEERRHPQR